MSDKPALFTSPLTYTAQRTQHLITIDGNLTEADWQTAQWSGAFTDIEGGLKPAPLLNTRMKMLWDDSCLYVAAQLQEPQLTAFLRQHDTIVFNDNDFEIFIDPDDDTHNYFEIEINTLNTIFDLFLSKPYRNRGNALIAYDVQGLQSAVQLQGTLNKSGDTDSGWTVEMKIPFRAVNFGFATSYTPTAGSFYRINFSRVEWDWNIAGNNYTKRKDSAGRQLPEHNWVWSPQGVINMHYPERWGYLFFGVNADTSYSLSPDEQLKSYLWLIYYKQQDYFKNKKAYAGKLSQLSIPTKVDVEHAQYHLSLASLSGRFVATIEDAQHQPLFSIDEDGKVMKLNKYE